MKGSGRAAEPSAGSLKGYQLGSDHQEQALARKKPRLAHNNPQAASGFTSQGPVSKQKAAEVEEAAPTVAGQDDLCKCLLLRHLKGLTKAEAAVAATHKKPVVFGGEAKALAELLTSQDDDTFETEALEETEIKEGITDILEAVKASQLRDKYFAYNPRGKAMDDYHSSDEDGDDQVYRSICFASLLVLCIDCPCINQSAGQLAPSSLSFGCLYRNPCPAGYGLVNHIEA